MEPVQLGTLNFASKKAARTFVKSFIERHGLGPVTAQEDIEWIEALLRRHPEPGKLRGWDGASVEVMRHEKFGTITFGVRISPTELRGVGAMRCIDEGVTDGPNTKEKLDDAEWVAAALIAVEAYEAQAAAAAL